MRKSEMKHLSPGDIVKHAMSLETYVVLANYGDRVTAVKSVDITNSSEWELCSKVLGRVSIPHSNQAP